MQHKTYYSLYWAQAFAKKLQKKKKENVQIWETKDVLGKPLWNVLWEK